MRNRRRLVASIIGIFGVTLSSLLGFTMPAQAATQLGGVSVVGACINQLFIAPPSARAVLIANNVSGWRCQYVGAGIPPVTYIWYNIDLNRECVVEFGSGAYARYFNFNDPYSWRCYR